MNHNTTNARLMMHTTVQLQGIQLQTAVLMLKSGLSVTNQIREFGHSYH